MQIGVVVNIEQKFYGDVMQNIWRTTGQVNGLEGPDPPRWNI